MSGRSHVLATSSSYSDSWEEQAFAEDSAVALGSCIWPWRSYSCSFCTREFRSAQALGGHMNVHRRERARLKQSPKAHQNPGTPLGIEYTPRVCTLVCNPNPDIVASTLSPLRASSPTIHENCREQNLVSQSYSSSLAQHHQNCSCFSSDPSFSIRALDILELKLGRENLRLGGIGCGMIKRVEPDLSMSSLNSAQCQYQTEDYVGDEEEISAKRRRKKVSSPLFIEPDLSERRIGVSSFFIKPSSCDRHQLQSAVDVLLLNPTEELDLELRLGDQPKVK